VSVQSVAWLDQSSFVSGSEEGLIAMWSAVTGECAARLTGHTLGVTCVLHGGVIATPTLVTAPVATRHKAPSQHLT